ncbi:hypothetical protein LG943_05535 [Streptomonospora sp. S1-112]|uniref:Uncharacterized protein n=1 Tax=Streptomonospora mangrovi TaxID=2883123 RepID=A0A9X3NKL4_9ACTN|nr:hypothetical protein [Streptomonospora mangrovi]MDA0563791.1 hypothetical protein [Streptomonospora mangrovi]
MRRSTDPAGGADGVGAAVGPGARAAEPAVPAACRPRVGAAVMHHPARERFLPDLLERCRPLTARPVADPDPGGPPSPLRTAKRAWAAVAPESTHHLVLQDDVVPVAGFARHVTAAVARRPEAAIALHVMWNAPINAYLARRAATAGSAWAQLSLHEYVPCQGLVLPAGRAHRLAAFLQGFPDSLKADDELVKRFCKEDGLEVWAVLPHLVEHRTVPSLAGNDDDGVRTGAVPFGATGGHTPAAPGAGRRPPRADAVPDFGLRLRRSECRIRPLPRDVRADFGWIPDQPWRCAVDGLGVSADQVLAGFGDAARRCLASVPGPPRWVAQELWAYAWLMGAEAARGGPFETGARAAALRDAALGTLAGSGLLPRHAAAMTPDAERAHARLAAAAVEAGARAVVDAGFATAGPPAESQRRRPR